MRTPVRLASFVTVALLLFAGCKKTADNSVNYRSAINAYYSAHPSCLWTESHQFPVQVGTHDDKARMYDALYDQGLLTRVATDKKKLFGLVDKEENTYDLADKGRGAWTPDPNQPGYGNFCYGSRSVSSIDSSTPNEGHTGDTTVVNYHWSFSGAPDWAKAQETQTAFPSVATNLAGNGQDTKTLVDTMNGWQLQGS